MALRGYPNAPACNILAAVAVCQLARTSSAQTSSLVQDDPRLYTISMELATQLELKSQKETDPEKKKNLHLSFMKDSGLSSPDYQMLLSEYQGYRLMVSQMRIFK